MPARLESLPPEVFNRILALLLHFKQVKRPVISGQSHGYAFETAVLRLNHGTHNVAQSFFNIENRWVKIRTNLPRLLICPLKLGIPAFQVPDSQLSLDIPEGIIQANIHFPQPMAYTQDNLWIIEQEDICGEIGNPTETVCNTYMILPPDLQDFMNCIRLNDLAYCARLRDHQRGAMANVVGDLEPALGLTLRIKVQSAASLDSYRTLLDTFSTLNGHFHHCLITNSSDIHHSRSVHRSITTSHNSLETLISEGLKLMLWLQSLAHEHMKSGCYDLALNAYASCDRFADCLAWRGHDEEHRNPSWLKNIFAAFDIANTANICVARVKGGLEDFNEMGHGREYTYRSTVKLARGMMDKYGHKVPGREPLLALIQAIVGCDQILNPKGSTTEGVHEIMEAFFRHAPDPSVRSFVDAVFEISSDLLSEWTQTKALKAKKALKEIKGLLKEVKPWRWVIHEDDFLIDEFKEGLQLVEGDEEDSYHLFEIPWGGRGRPGWRYLL